MDTPNEDPKVVENSAYNPFPEPQTIPSGWDLSGLVSTPSIRLEDKEEATDSY